MSSRSPNCASTATSASRSRPNSAISLGAEYYEIAPGRCTECVGHYDTPQCVEVCPVECIIDDPERPESREQLLAKFQILTREEKP